MPRGTHLIFASPKKGGPKKGDPVSASQGISRSSTRFDFNTMYCQLSIENKDPQANTSKPWIGVERSEAQQISR